jgi:hypothetical protein
LCPHFRSARKGPEKADPSKNLLLIAVGIINPKNSILDCALALIVAKWRHVPKIPANIGHVLGIGNNVPWTIMTDRQNVSTWIYFISIVSVLAHRFSFFLVLD